jgi:hypothetical protein
LENVDILYGHLEYFTDIWDIFDHLVHFVFIWYIFPVLESCTKKNLATLLHIRFFCCKKNVGNKDSDQVFPISRFGLVSVDILCLHTQLVTFCPGMSALSINWHLPSHTMPHTLKAICMHIHTSSSVFINISFVIVHSFEALT